MNSHAPNEVTQKDFAALRGVSPALVSKWKDQGRLVMNKAGNRVLVAETTAVLERTRDPARGGDRTGRGRQVASSAPPAPADGAGRAGRAGEGPVDGLVYQAEAAREKRAAAQLRELELAEKAGELVMAVLADRRAFELARAGRDAVMAVPDRLSTLLAAESNPAKVHALLLAECRRICLQMSGRGDEAEPAPSQEAA